VCNSYAQFSTLLREFQRYIRGLGLAYYAFVGVDLEAGLVTFTLYRVRSIVLSDYHFPFDETRHLGRVRTALKLSNKGRRSSVVSLMAQYVLKHLCWSPIPNISQIALEDIALDTAKSSIVYSVTKGVSTPGDAVRWRLIIACIG